MDFYKSTDIMINMTKSDAKAAIVEMVVFGYQPFTFFSQSVGFNMFVKQIVEKLQVKTKIEA